MKSQHQEELKLTRQQQEALHAIGMFLGSSDSVFILRGYAGTGKTTLIKEVVRSLKLRNQSFDVFAPTGKAAKVLRDKTHTSEDDEFGTTIHRGIYEFDDIKVETEIVENPPEHKGQENHETYDSDVKIYFPIRILDDTNHVVIVDEASMVAKQESIHEILRFGTGSILNDLLTYTRIPGSSNKIIFIGDPAQLPPVGESTSLALEPEFFTKLKIPCQTVELTQVVRQLENSSVLTNATNIRSLIGNPDKSKLDFILDDNCVEADPETFVEKYLHENPEPRLGNGTIINWRNSDCLWYNQIVRQHYFPGKPSVQVGDLLIVNRNSYGVFDGIVLHNGDIIQIVDIYGDTIREGARLYVNKDGKKIPVTFTFQFREVNFQTQDNEKARGIILESMLHDAKGALDVNEMNGLYVNFKMRLDNERKSAELPPLKSGSDLYKQKLRSDPLLNALQVKFAYAITCHKSQGSEWESAFINYTGRTGLSADHLRWSYTATTRAKKRLTVLHPPKVGLESLLKMEGSSVFTNPPADIIDWAPAPSTPFHNEGSHPCKRYKYFETLQLLEGSLYKISHIDSRPFQEMYYIEVGAETYRYDTHHNNAGIFRPFTIQKGGENAGEILVLINSLPERNFRIQYTPSETFLQRLFDKVRSVCDQLGIQITSVSERPGNYYVKYSLYHNGAFAQVQFYFKGNKQFTSVQSSVQANSDSIFMEKFKELMGAS